MQERSCIFMIIIFWITMKFYTGVGARETPANELIDMTNYASILESKGFILRSGGQRKGADGAFESGVKMHWNKVIYKPRHWSRNYNDPVVLDEAYKIAQRHHPGWNRLSDVVKNLMARNVHAVLGDNLDNPSLFLMCYTKDGMITLEERTYKSGGTGHTLSVAIEFNVPILNMQRSDDKTYIETILLNI